MSLCWRFASLLDEAGLRPVSSEQLGRSMNRVASGVSLDSLDEFGERNCIVVARESGLFLGDFYESVVSR